MNINKMNGLWGMIRLRDCQIFLTPDLISTIIRIFKGTTMGKGSVVGAVWICALLVKPRTQGEIIEIFLKPAAHSDKECLCMGWVRARVRE